MQKIITEPLPGSSAGFCKNLMFQFVSFCQFMSDARECESYLRQLQETIKRQYTCDKNSRLSKLEDLLQDSMVSTFPQLPSPVLSAVLSGTVDNLVGNTSNLQLPSVNEGTEFLE